MITCFDVAAPRVVGSWTQLLVGRLPQRRSVAGRAPGRNCDGFSRRDCCRRACALPRRASPNPTVCCPRASKKVR